MTKCKITENLRKGRRGMETQRHRQPQVQHIAFQGISISQGVSPIPFVIPGVSGRENMAAGAEKVKGKAWGPLCGQGEHIRASLRKTLWVKVVGPQGLISLEPIL